MPKRQRELVISHEGHPVTLTGPRKVIRRIERDPARLSALTRDIGLEFHRAVGYPQLPAQNQAGAILERLETGMRHVLDKYGLSESQTGRGGTHRG